jgi:hypothetical protein
MENSGKSVMAKLSPVSAPDGRPAPEAVRPRSDSGFNSAEFAGCMVNERLNIGKRAVFDQSPIYQTNRYKWRSDAKIAFLR